jgi:digeranylgeranylglycerophospholipid reductase
MTSGYDVVVVGAGPSGSVAARRAAEGGLKTLLIEKRQEIGVPVRCAEAVGAKSTQEFIELNPRWINAEIDTFTVFNSQDVCALFPPTEPTLVINRKGFDYELALLAARAGALIRTHTAAVGLEMEDCSIKGIFVESFGQTETIRTKLVVAADGTESQVARWAGLNTVPSRRDYYIGLEFLLGGLEGKINPQHCEYHLDHSLAPGGYLWVFPKGVNTANVGLVIPSDLTSSFNPLRSLDKFVSKRYPKASHLAVIAGGIPVTGALSSMVADGLIIIGDAAHQADPLMAGGINLSMIGADLAMQVAVPALYDGDVSVSRLHTYDLLWNQRFGKMHRALYKIRKIFAKLSQERLDALINRAAELPGQKLTLGQIILAVLKTDPLLLLEARTLITTGLITR